jgi:hypothetical protein
LERLHYFINPQADYQGYAFTSQLSGKDLILGRGTAVRYVGNDPAILKILLAERARFVAEAN